MNNIQRFKDAQARDYATALSEIKAGRKRTHWMWYIFPQIAGLGHSPTAQYYAIKDLDEAKAYLADPVLGPRLIEISRALLELPTDDPHCVFGSPDDLKLLSCMTLFDIAAFDIAADGSTDVFAKVREKYYGGRQDERTLALINA